MFSRFFVILFAGVLLELKLTQCAPADVGKTKEKVRAYEFGYSIEENQHRHEKRDENGIVMGEFGFITADGIYHVTVYATDENGKFKILAMKSYPYANPEKKMLVIMPPPKKPVVVPPVRKAIPLDNKSCGGCVLTKKFVPDPADVVQQTPKDPEAVFRTLSKTINDSPATKKNLPPSVGISPKGTPSLPQKPNAIGSTPLTNGKDYPLTNPPLTQIPANRQSKTITQPPQIDVRLGSPNVPTKSNQLTPTSQRNPPTVGGTFNPLPKKPVTTTNNPPNEVAHNKNPPSQGSSTLTPNTATVSLQNAKEPKSFQPLNKVLPNEVSSPTQNTIKPLTENTLLQQTGQANNALAQPRLTNNLIPIGIQLQNKNGAKASTPNLPSTKNLTPNAPSSQSIGKVTPANNDGGPLYRFKYVLDYNGHREEGRLNGSKEGNYNTIGDDGIRRIIDYIANENGYQPHIKWERVPPNELPTGENKLKEYEFVWFNSK